MDKVTEEDLRNAQKALGIRLRNPKNLKDWDSLILAPAENEPAIMAGEGLKDKLYRRMAMPPDQISNENLERIIEALITWSSFVCINPLSEGAPLDPEMAICGNLHSLFKSLHISSEGFLSPSHVIGINFIEFPSAVCETFPVGGSREYVRGVESGNFWGLSGDGDKRRRLCLWMADQLKTELEQRG